MEMTPGCSATLDLGELYDDDVVEMTMENNSGSAGRTSVGTASVMVKKS